VIIELAGVSVRRSGRTILGPLDWVVAPGERWVVLGANGSGKSTLLSVVDMALWPTTGRVDVLGATYGRVDAREHRRRIGLAGSAVEAAFRDDLTPPRSTRRPSPGGTSTATTTGRGPATSPSG